jgi:DNA-directed RNA polymerase specialized sigma24 family protein
VELRAVFVFHLLGGLAMAEIAALLGVDEMMVRGARTWVSYRMVRAEQESS